MDSDTHVELGLALISVAQCADVRAVAACLFPQIDRQPAYFHRLFAHCFDQVPNLVAAASSSGFWVHRGEPPTEHGAHSAPTSAEYIVNRLAAERVRLEGYLSRHTGADLIGGAPPSDDSVALCVVSHIYNDMFNNPVQAFAPATSLPSGVWDLWDEMGTIEFRRLLYSPARIADLRNEFFAQDEWSVNFTCAVLCAAMVSRVAGAAATPIEEEVWRRSCERLGVGEALDRSELVEAISFLEHQERRLSDLFLKFGR